MERDEGKQFFRVGFALISGTDEMSIKYKRDKVGDDAGREDRSDSRTDDAPTTRE